MVEKCNDIFKCFDPWSIHVEILKVMFKCVELYFSLQGETVRPVWTVNVAEKVQLMDNPFKNINFVLTLKTAGQFQPFYRVYHPNGPNVLILMYKKNVALLII